MTRQLVLCLLVGGLAAVALVLLGSSAWSDPAPPSSNDHAARSARTRVAAGELSPPSSRPAVEVARAYLAAQVEPRAASDAAALPATVRARPDGGALVRFGQRHGGLPVVGGGAAVRVDARGRVRWARSSIAAMPVDLDVRPAIDAGAAYRAAGGASSADPTGRARLVVYAPPAWPRPRLAWEVSLPRDLDRREQIRAWVDAETGAVLGRVNLVVSAANHRARAYLENPVSTPELSEVVLGDIPVGGERLAGPDIEVFNCVDRRTCGDFPVGDETRSVHRCELEAVAATGPDGDFLAIDRPASDVDPTDSFAEIQMYFHTTKAYAAFREMLGDPDFVLDARPLTAIANLRLSSTECKDGAPPKGAQLVALDNAFFAPAGEVPLFDRDVIAFGQGTDLDFSYDGDVVYHELGHAFVFRLSELGFGFADEAGVDTTPAGLHEGYADYVSSVITGDPLVAEYAGAALNPSGGALRNLDNDFTCPQHLSGESHFDSESWSGALWQMREATEAADRPAFDRAVVTAVAGLGPGDGFSVAVDLTVAEVEVALGRAAAERVRSVFEARGLDDCAGRVLDLAVGDRFELLFLNGYGAAPGPIIPAVVQFRVVLDEPASGLRLGFVDLANGPTELSLLVKAGEQPIRWTWSATGGEHDAPLAAELDTSGTVAEVPGDFAPGVYHLQLASGPGGAFLADIGFAPITVGGPDAGPARPDAGPVAGGDGNEGGCGCRGAGDGGGVGSALALLALAASRRRRRARNSPR
jgi:hypothetical protein